MHFSGNTSTKPAYIETEPLIDEPEQETTVPLLEKRKNSDVDQSGDSITPTNQPKRRKSDSGLSKDFLKPLNLSKRRKSDTNQLDSSLLIPPNQSERRKSDTNQSDISLLIPPDQSKRRQSDTSLLNQSERSKSDNVKFRKNSEKEWWGFAPGIQSKGKKSENQSQKKKSNQSERRKSETAGVVSKKPEPVRKPSSPLDVLIALVRSTILHPKRICEILYFLCSVLGHLA